MKDTGHVTKILTWILFDFQGLFVASVYIYIRIEVPFLFAFGNERTLVACKSLRSASRFTRFTRDQCPFIPKCKQKWVLQSLSRSLPSWWGSLRVDQWVPGGTCSKVLRLTSVDLWRVESIKIFHVKIDWNCNVVGLLHNPFWLQLIWRFWDIDFKLLKLLLRNTDEGSVPEMRIWSILLIKSDLKLCIHLSKSLFL